MRKIISVFLIMSFLISAVAGCSTPESVSESVSEAIVESEAPVVNEVPPQPVSSSTEQPDESSEVEYEPEDGDELEEFEDEDPPYNGWRFDSPENHGVDSERLEAIHGRLAGSQMLAVVIVKDGVVIDEFYQEGQSKNSVYRMNSVTKSLMGSLIGIAIDEGVLDSVDVKMMEYFPQLDDLEEPRKAEITLEHMLEHTSGIRWNEWNGGQSFRNLRGAENWVDHYLSQPMDADPGTTFSYSTAGSHMLAAVLEKASGMSTYDYAMEHMFKPMGIDRLQWTKDPQGVTDGGNGLILGIRDAAKFGQLYLDNGNWRGIQIVPQEWVEASTKAKSDGEPDAGAYGYQWWIESFGSEKQYSGYYALGYAGQFIFVVPELDLVMAVASKSTWSEYTARICFNEVIAACTT